MTWESFNDRTWFFVPNCYWNLTVVRMGLSMRCQSHGRTAPFWAFVFLCIYVTCADTGKHTYTIARGCSLDVSKGMSLGQHHHISWSCQEILRYIEASSGHISRLEWAYIAASSGHISRPRVDGFILVFCSLLCQQVALNHPERMATHSIEKLSLDRVICSSSCMVFRSTSTATASTSSASSLAISFCWSWIPRPKDMPRTFQGCATKTRRRLIPSHEGRLFALFFPLVDELQWITSFFLFHGHGRKSRMVYEKHQPESRRAREETIMGWESMDLLSPLDSAPLQLEARQWCLYRDYLQTPTSSSCTKLHRISSWRACISLDFMFHAILHTKWCQDEKMTQSFTRCHTSVGAKNPYHLSLWAMIITT